jgi:multicomponent Na+:H+ antiporter subunit E
MSPVSKQRRDGSVGLARHRSVQPLVIVWLTVVWVALWGDLSLANVVSGAALGVAVCLVFPLPPLRMHLRVRPLPLVWLVLRFLGDVVAASVEVAWKTLQLHRQPRNAVIEVDLHTHSDFVLTVVAEMVSLVPGSLVVEARRSTHTLFLHVLDVGDLRGVQRMRQQTLALERRVVLALGAETAHLGPPPDVTPGSEATP